MVQAAERAGVEHFVFFSTLGASSHDRTRVLRAKALAERAVLESGVRPTVFAPSLVYAPGDRLTTFLERMAMVSPVMPISGRGEAPFQPIWAEDVADCVMRVLEQRRGVRRRARGPRALRARRPADALAPGDRRARARAAGRSRPLVSIPAPVVARVLRAPRC